MTQTAIPEHARTGAPLDPGFIVDETLCTSCGLCARDCPMGLLQGDPPHMEQADLCVRCQHCMAICPTGAVSIEGRKPEASLLLSMGELPPCEQVIHLVRGRRSIRQYEDRDVDPALLRRLLDATAYAPTGVNSQQLTLTVVDQRSVLHRIREQVLAGVTRCAQEGRIPEHFSFLATVPSAFSDRGVDAIFRGAPHLLIASAPFSAPTGEVDVPIALTTFELMAASAGLGTVWCGFLKIVLEMAPELKPLLDLPSDGVHYYAMLFGYPAVKYTRAVQRDGAAVVKRLS